MLKITSYIVFTLLMGLSVAHSSELNTYGKSDLNSLKRLERTQAKMLLKIMDKKGRVNEFDSERANDYLARQRQEALENLNDHKLNTLTSVGKI